MSYYHFPFALTALLLGVSIPAAWADGTLTHMSGIVSVLKADGKTAPGVQGEKAYPGDTVITGVGGYVRIEMTDGGELVLRPDSRLKIEAYKFAVAQASEDSFVFSLLRGGMRTVTGLIGKRGNRDAYKLTTTTATIGIRGTQFDLRVCQGNCGALDDGTYLAVRFGAVLASNTQGSLAVAAGQVAHVPSQLAPLMLRRDPGIGFTPPAVIPKLDEKKKAQPTTAATTTEQLNPAAGGSGQTVQTEPTSAQAAGAKTESQQGSAGTAESSGKTNASASMPGVEPAAGTAPPVSTPATPPADGVDCSIQ